MRIPASIEVMKRNDKKTPFLNPSILHVISKYYLMILIVLLQKESCWLSSDC